MFTHLLVPVDGSAVSDQLVDVSVRAARMDNARITFFHASSDYGATSDGALAHAAWPAEFAHLANAQALTILAKAEAAARSASVPCHVVTRMGTRVHELIHQAALQSGCDVIFIASRPGGVVARLLHRSVTARLLEVSTLPVLVAASITDAGTSDQDVASRILRDEHRSLAAVLHALKDVVARTAFTGQQADFRLLRAMIFYIETFPERQHHPKEEMFVFSKLRQRAPHVQPLLERLQHEHQTGHVRLQELRSALAAAEQNPPSGTEPFEAAVDRFVAEQFAHMTLEEQSLMPAASNHFTPQDWTEIKHAFQDNADHRFVAEEDESFNHLLGRILSLASDWPERADDLQTREIEK